MTKLCINNNINDLYNCDYLSITCLSIFVPINITLLLNKFTNLQKLYLSNNKLTEIKGLDKLVNLQELDLSNNEITEIKSLNTLVGLQKLYLSNNQITEIKDIDNLINLQVLNLSNNLITEIKGLDNLVNLQILSLYDNQITEIQGLYNLVNLKELYLHNNQITEIKGLDNIINLQILYLNENEITEIKMLDNLINLKILYLSNNKITEIKGLNTLESLQTLSINDNKLTEIKGLSTLANLHKLYFYNNQIKELPLSLCNLRNINDICFYNNPLEYISLPVQRWLTILNNRVRKNNMVYNDKQNIHNHHIQNSFRNSLNNILKDTQLLNLQTIKQQILENNILTEQTKREILNYCDDSNAMHSIFLITYSDLLIYVWSRITFSANKDEILQVLNQEISDGLCMCFTGRLTRLLNTLVGFYDDIELQISDSEQITNIIMTLKNKFPSDQEQLKDAVRKELVDRQYSESIINEWLDYI